MKNQTSFENFHILAFFGNAENKHFLFTLFFFIYITGVFGNFVLIALVLMNVHLHTPMYFLLCNLSIIDLIFTTVTVPKLMDILLSRNNLIPFGQCFTQMYFFIFMGSSEAILLSSMAYDRYVAICHPLQYHRIMQKRTFVFLMVAPWIFGSINSSVLTGFASKLSFCHSNRIHHFFCDDKALARISCGSRQFFIILYVETVLVGLCPFFLCLISYSKIITVVFHMKSKIGRRKAYSTCTSHLMVLLLYYGVGALVYLKPSGKNSEDIDNMSAVLFTAVTPILNPIIYSLRNNDVKNTLLGISGRKGMQRKPRN